MWRQYWGGTDEMRRRESTAVSLPLPNFTVLIKLLCFSATQCPCNTAITMYFKKRSGPFHSFTAKTNKRFDSCLSTQKISFCSNTSKTPSYLGRNKWLFLFEQINPQSFWLNHTNTAALPVLFTNLFDSVFARVISSPLVVEVELIRACICDEG